MVNLFWTESNELAYLGSIANVTCFENNKLIWLASSSSAVVEKPIVNPKITG